MIGTNCASCDRGPKSLCGVAVEAVSDLEAKSYKRSK